MKWFRLFFVTIIMSILMAMPVQGTTIITYLELVLSDSGELLNGEYDFVMSLQDADGEELWSETQSDIIVSNGIVSFPFGNINELETYYFFESDTQLLLTVNDETIELPMYSIPFSFFSHAADIVNSIQMNGVFHSDLVNERIGINIDHTTPSVRLELGGAMKLSSANTTETGTIRWNEESFRLEGLHNDGWKLLDVSESDKFDSKWTENELIDAFYVFNQSVYIGANGNGEALFVDGDVYGSEDLSLTGDFSSEAQLVFGEYGISITGNVKAKDIYLDADNYFDFTDGLIFSGVIYGDGAGLTSIDSDSIVLNSIQNIEVDSLVFSSEYFTDDSISNDKLTTEFIDQTLLSDDFVLDNSFFLPLIVSDNLIERGTVLVEDLAEDFDLTTYQFVDGALVSSNIGSQAIDGDKINDDELLSEDFELEFIDDYMLIGLNELSTDHFQDETVQLEDIQSGGLTFEHLISEIAFDYGGTNQTLFGDEGEFIVVSNNQFISVDTIVVTDVGLGVNQSSPEYALDIVQHDDALYPLKVQSLSASDTSLVLRNDLGIWALKVDASGLLVVENQLISTFNLFELDANGFVGIMSDIGVEKLTLSGALHVGDTIVDSSLLNSGTMYFSDSESEFKFVTDSGVQSLAFQDVMDWIPSYLYTKNIQNQSEDSRVLLGDGVSLFGAHHIVSGGFNSYVDGASQLAQFLIDTQMVGSESMANFVDSSAIFGDSLDIDYVDSSVIVGNGHVVSHVDQSTLFGTNQQIQMGVNIDVSGVGVQGDYLKSVVIRGNHGVLNYVSDSNVMGDRHALYQSKFVDLFGVANQLDYGASVMVDGVGNSLRQLYDTAINGDENVVSFTSHASIVGSNNHVMMGDGQYIGSKNRHFGGGEPIVIGDQNVLFGHQSHIVDSDRSMIIGSSDQPDEFNLDDSIILLAHGGVDIIHHGVTVAHLAEGAGSWGHVSDRDLKINIQPINQSKVLETMLSLSVSEWRYKGQDYIQHIGPMAQDFYQLFQFGNDDRFINSVDIDGVILASIQGLGSDVVEFRSQKELLLASAHNQNQKMLAFIRDKEGVIVSANLLSEQALDIHERYERLHHLEIDQRLAIESLNERIVRVKEYLEKMQ